jgi:hypothetical protein
MKAIRAAGKAIQPPKHITLRPEDKPHWRAIIKARAADSWNDSDLEVAGELARTRSDIESFRALISVQGHIVDGKVNVLHGLLEQLVRRQNALSRILGIHAGHVVGQARDSAKRTAAQRKLLATIEDESLYEDNLLARPYWLDEHSKN